MHYWKSTLDFAILSAAVYVLLVAARQARIIRIAVLIFIFHASALLANHYELVVGGWVLDAALVTMAVAILVFQPELRQSLMGLDRFLFFRGTLGDGADVFRAIAGAAFNLAHTRTGALIVIPAADAISELVDGGVSIDAKISSPLLESIFQKSSPLHDGAAILGAGRLSAVQVILPQTLRCDIPLDFGTRHRAALGLAEKCDAFIVVVSEQRGHVALVRRSSVTVLHAPEELLATLVKQSPSPIDGARRYPARSLFMNFRLKLSAIGLSAALWLLSFSIGGSGVRSVEVPLEIDNLPRGLQIYHESAGVIRMQLRGRKLLFDAVNLRPLVAHLDLRGAREGRLSIPLTAAVIDLPPGIRVERTVPAYLTLDLTYNR